MPSELTTPTQITQAQSVAAGPDCGRGSRGPRKRNGGRKTRGLANPIAPTEVSSSQAHDSATSNAIASQRNKQTLKEEIHEAKNAQSDPTPKKSINNTQPMPTPLPATQNTASNNDENNTTEQHDSRPKTNKRSAKKRKNWQKSKTALWKKHLPTDSVDPITLDPLASLKYPPFALVADEPYLPIDWPQDRREDELSKKPSGTETEDQRQARILREQWGVVLPLKDSGKNPVSEPTEKLNPSNKERHTNLFDGRALAYYMVSQLQFIDPLNRRDLTRDEIVHLDQYLRRHNFFDLNVTEAYDAKGITVSSAGATAQTASGRATILQEEARHLLNALFGSRQGRPTAPANSFAREYQDHEASQVQRLQPRHSSRPFPPSVSEDTGVYGQGTAYVVIDDDINPGLRSGNSNHLHQPASRLRGSADSFSPTRALETMFPPLDTTTTIRTETEEGTKPSPATNLPRTKTLSKIGSVVQKTDPIEQQRQWEAREAAIRKAALVNRSFSNVNPVGSVGPPTSSVIVSSTVLEPTDGQIQRNKAIAEALGVKPTTSRTNLRTGWTRPLDGTDEFGNELAVTIYPESLVIEARNLKPGFLTKIERKWKIFLADDSSSSLSLSPMDRPTRKTIHEYSDFWKLQTESFDPEPQRYIHCVKLGNTSAPKPLLSEVLYQPQQPTIDKSRHQLTAGPESGRDIPQPPIRTPLLLQPRSDGSKSTPALSGMSLNGLPRLSMGDTAIASRFDALSEGRERPKLQLAKRTLPLEQPAFQPVKDDEKVDGFREKAKRAMAQKEMTEQRTKKAIEAAFASDDEASEASSSSGWEEQAPTFVVSDEDA